MPLVSSCASAPRSPSWAWSSSLSCLVLCIYLCRMGAFNKAHPRRSMPARSRTGPTVLRADVQRLQQGVVKSTQITQRHFSMSVHQPLHSPTPTLHFDYRMFLDLIFKSPNLQISRSYPDIRISWVYRRRVSCGVLCFLNCTSATLPETLASQTCCAPTRRTSLSLRALFPCAIARDTPYSPLV